MADGDATESSHGAGRKDGGGGGDPCGSGRFVPIIATGGDIEDAAGLGGGAAWGLVVVVTVMIRVGACTSSAAPAVEGAETAFVFGVKTKACLRASERALPNNVFGTAPPRPPKEENTSALLLEQGVLYQVLTALNASSFHGRSMGIEY